MQSRRPWLPLLLAIMLFCLCIQRRESGLKQSAPPGRIISLAPNITEILFALGCGDRVVGVTDYCRFPPEAAKIAHVGGFFNPNLEMLVSLRPDLVLMLKEHRRVEEFLVKRKIPYRTIDDNDLEAILASFGVVGEACREEEKAENLANDMRRMIGETARQSEVKPRVLICVGRNAVGSGTIEQPFFAGPATFYNDLLRIAGGINAVDDTMPIYPSLSHEALVRIGADIIIDIVPPQENKNSNRAREDWWRFDMIPAVRGEMVYVLDSSYTTIPGPRITKTLRDFREIVTRYEARFAGRETGTVSGGAGERE